MNKTLQSILPYELRLKINKIINVNIFQYLKAKFFNKNNLKFEFNKNYYNYYVALHNKTYTNERTVEIPIILDYINKSEKKNILEIGNVLNYYQKFHHDVLDKYEKKDNVINCDIIDFQPKNKYDLIVSISTFEHIGFDEASRYGEKKETYINQISLLKAIKNTKSLLNEKGTFIFTAPYGFNRFLDGQIVDNQLELSQMHFLQRVSANNTWIEVKHKEITKIKYNHPYPCANALIVGIYHKS